MGSRTPAVAQVTPSHMKNLDYFAAAAKLTLRTRGVLLALLGQVVLVLLQVLVLTKILQNSAAVHVLDEFVNFVVGAQVGIWRWG